MTQLAVGSHFRKKQVFEEFFFIIIIIIHCYHKGHCVKDFY